MNMQDDPRVVAERALSAEQRKDWVEAERGFRRLGELRPDSNFEGHLAVALFRLGRYEESLPYFAAHRMRHPGDETLSLAEALSLLKLFRWEESLAIGRRLLPVQYNEVVVELVLNCLINLGITDESDALCERALRDFPRHPIILGLIVHHLLKNRDFGRGFALMPAFRRRYMQHKPPMDTPPAGGWDGKRFDGLLLVDGEQGIGEEVLAASMFGDIAAMGQPCVISCDPRLIPLFERSFPSLRFVSRFDGSLDRIQEECGQRTIRAYAIDLACVLRNRPFRHDKPWLVADPQRVRELRTRYETRYPGKRLKALSWRTVREVPGSPRSIRLPELLPLFLLPGVAWLNVQYGDYTADITELAALGVEVPWDDLTVDQTHDLDALAAQLCAVDSLVSISNTAVHLAAALGVTCHLLMPHSRPVMWYWGYDGDTTPWYPPCLHILRNDREDDWTGLATRLADTLTSGIGNPSPAAGESPA